MIVIYDVERRIQTKIIILKGLVHISLASIYSNVDSIANDLPIISN